MMEQNKEYIYRDKNSLSPRAIKIFGRFVLYSFLFLIIIQLVILLFEDWALYTLFILLPAFAISLFTLLMWVAYNTLEMWIADSRLHYKGALSIFKSRSIPLTDIKSASVEASYYKGRRHSIDVVLNLYNGKNILLVDYNSSPKSEKKAKDVQDAINKILLTHSSTIHRGEELLQNGNFDQAIHELNRVIDINSNDARAFYLRSLAKKQTKDLNGALEDITRAIELAPNEGILYMKRSFLHDQLGMWEAAWIDLEKHTKLIPEVTSNQNYMSYKKRLASKTGRS